MKSPSLERQVLDALPITICAVDLDGRITFLNRSPTRTTEPNRRPQLLDERAVLGASLRDAITDDAVRAGVEQALATLREGAATTVSWEFSFTSPADERVLLLQVSVLVGRQAVVGYVFSAADIATGHRSPDVSVRQVEHRQRLDAIGEVSAGVAQELRNPLFGISSAAQLLRFRIKDDPIVEKHVGRILREVERLNGMATALLEYGKPDAMRLEPGDPDAVWDEVLEHQRGRLESRALLVHRSRAEPPQRCAIDTGQLAQVFVNLLANATEAAPEGTDLTLESTAHPDGAWRCRLHNGGGAIPADALPRVFEIFFSTRPGSTGIGLALCQRIVEGHRGAITLESTPERGTAVTVVLPGLARHTRGA